MQNAIILLVVVFFSYWGIGALRNKQDALKDAIIGTVILATAMIILGIIVYTSIK